MSEAGGTLLPMEYWESPVQYLGLWFMVSDHVQPDVRGLESLSLPELLDDLLLLSRGQGSEGSSRFSRWVTYRL